MAQEDAIILKVSTGEAVKSVNDLKDNIKMLKTSLGELEIGTEAYQNTLDELKVNQNALKDAMYATSSSMDDVAKSATGASKSYNSLVHQMASLKEEWRATNDEARRNELGEQIAKINTELKEMDASVGNFQRNVGNYESGVTGLVAKFDQWGATLKQLPPTLGSTKEAIGKVGETMQLVGKNPVLGIIGLVVPIIMKITDALKENETAMSGVKKVMDLLNPVFEFLNGILEKVAEGFVKIVEKVASLVGGNGWFDKAITSITGVGNVMIQHMLTPIKVLIEAFTGLGNVMKDVFTGQWGKVKEDAKNAWEGIKEVFKEGFSFKQNFETGKEWGKQFLAGVKTNHKEAEEAGEVIAQEVTKPIKRDKKTIAVIRKEEQSAEEKFTQKMQDEWKKRTEANIQAEKIAREEAEKTRLGRIASMDAVASSTSAILSSIADMYEQDGEVTKKEAKKIKRLRIASATIDMLQGAVTAFTSAMSLPFPYNLVAGGTSATAVLAMGAMNINKIKSTNFESGEGADITGASSSLGASVSAPSVETPLTNTRNVTSASEEDRLNRMASSQRVYILQSDIEASGHQSKVQVAESSF